MDISKLLHGLGVANSDEGQTAPTLSPPKSALKAPPACGDKVCDDTPLGGVIDDNWFLFASFFSVDSPQSTVDSAPATRRVRFAPTAYAQTCGVSSASSQAQDKAQDNVPDHHPADHEMARIFREKSPRPASQASEREQPVKGTASKSSSSSPRLLPARTLHR